MTDCPKDTTDIAERLRVMLAHYPDDRLHADALAEITRLRDLLRRWHAAGSLSGGQLADLIRETEGVLG